VPPWHVLGPPEAGDARPHSVRSVAGVGARKVVLGRGKRCGRVALGGKQEAAAG